MLNFGKMIDHPHIKLDDKWDGQCILIHSNLIHGGEGKLFLARSDCKQKVLPPPPVYHRYHMPLNTKPRI